MVSAGLPLFGYLRYTRLENHAAAGREMSLACFFGFLPVLTAILISYLVKGTAGVGPAIQFQVDTGSIFLVCAALLSSYIYVLWGEQLDPGLAPFPHKTAFSLIFVGMIVAWAIVMGLQALNAKNVGATISLDSDALRALTIVSLVMSFTCLYLMFVYRSAIKPGYAGITREETESFSSDWQGR
ncbi:MAG TPA: hypothetical protein VF633_03200 [Brevundimonas sp.]|jgi:vacuolar-type H+-ATPase subunit I/STV1